MASADLPKTAFHTCVWINISAGRNRISRFGAFEEDSVRQTISSNIRMPIRYPRVLRLWKNQGVEISYRSESSSPTLEVIDAADTLLSILDDLREQKGES
jgi:hypothetical protein